jgi:butyryl-CoA dehydrogenase
MRPVAAQHDVDQTYPWEVQRAIRDAGLSGVWIPQEYGGLGCGVLELCLVVEEFSRACGGMGVGYAVNALGSFPIMVGGSDEQKDRWLPPIAAGEKLIAFGLSEKDAGSDAGSTTTRAEANGDYHILNGEKKWNTGGAVAALNTIFAVSEPGRGARGISAFVVEKDTPGYRVGKHEDKMGIRCVPVVEIHLENCRVPKANLLGGEPGRGFRHAMETLDRARPGVAAQAVGLAQGALDLAIAYSGYGYCRDHPIEEYMRDAKITQIYEGTNQIQRLVIARALLREAAGAPD